MSTIENVSLFPNGLFKAAMCGDWNSVAKLYKDHSVARRAKITRTGDTVLHLAVRSKVYSTVDTLVGIITESGEKSEILQLKNDEGNTPLHVASILGILFTNCKSLIHECTDLIVESFNDVGETPLFLAASHGHKTEFLELHNIISKGSIQGNYKNYCTRKDGDNILHCAIRGEHFDLALHVIRKYEDLANIRNHKGHTALHLLADIPSAFKQHASYIYEGLPTNVHIPEDQEGTIIWSILKNKYDERWLDNQHVEGKDGMSQLMGDEENILPESVTNPSEDARVGVNREEETLLQTFVKKVKFYCSLWVWMFVLTAVYGHKGVQKIKDMLSTKQKRRDAIRVMRKLIQLSNIWEKYEDIQEPSSSTNQESLAETPILVATKRGVTEMVQEIIQTYPIAVRDFNEEHKNIVLLAVENRQSQLYEYLCENKFLMDPLFDAVDSKGNTALHLAATMPIDGHPLPWVVSGAALQMQWEIKWFKYVKKTMKGKLMARNEEGKVANDIFIESHRELMKEGKRWLKDTSQSCSLVAILITTVIFTSATIVPIGLPEEASNRLERHYIVPMGRFAFEFFRHATMVAMIFSVLALASFLIVLTSRYLEEEFDRFLMTRLIHGLYFLYTSITCMAMAFIAGHFYVNINIHGNLAITVYVAICSFFGVLFWTILFPMLIAISKSTKTHLPIRA